jgi:hypothetical protein
MIRGGLRNCIPKSKSKNKFKSKSVVEVKGVASQVIAPKIGARTWGTRRGQNQDQNQGQQTHICQKKADMGHQTHTKPTPEPEAEATS